MKGKRNNKKTKLGKNSFYLPLNIILHEKTLGKKTKKKNYRSINMIGYLNLFFLKKYYDKYVN